MSNLPTNNEEPKRLTDAATVDLKLEVTIIPVADVDRAKRFYERLGWRLDADFAFDNGLRVVQFTPPGSGCSIRFWHEHRVGRRQDRPRICTARCRWATAVS